MKIFQLYGKYLAFVGVEHLQPFQKNYLTIVYLKRTLVFFSLIIHIIFLTIFIGFEAKTVNEYSDSLYMFACLITALCVFPITLWKMESLFKFIECLENLIRQRMESPESKLKYLKLIENIAKWTGIFYFYVVQVTIPSIFVPHFMISFYRYFSTDLNGQAFSLPFPIWTPFDWRTPIGYLIIYSIEFSAAFYMTHIAACLFGTLFTSCSIIFTFCNEIKNDIHALDESSKGDESPVILMKRIVDIVGFHATAKQLISDMDNTFALIIVVYILWFLSAICGTLLMVQMALEQNVKPFELTKPFFLVFWAFALLFLFCEFGQLLTNHFDQLNVAIADCDWTLFPDKIRKLLPIITQNAQRPVVLRTFENASCSRETFKKVSNRGFSWFMVFRQFR